MSLNGFDEVGEHRTILQSARFGDGQHAFDKSASRFALRAKAEFTIDHSWTQCALGRVVRGLDCLDFGEGSKPLAAIIKLPTHAHQTRVSTELTAQ